MSKSAHFVRNTIGRGVQALIEHGMKDVSGNVVQ